jgi:hypothetical protein
MSGNLFDAVYRALTGGYSPRGEGSLRRQMRTLESKHGGVRAAAADAGVSESTWRRWRKGRSTPKPENADKVKAARRRALVPEERRRLVSRSTGIRPSDPGLAIKATVTVSSDTRPGRLLRLGPWLPPGRLDRMTTAFLDGDDEGVRQEIQDAVNEYVASGGGPGAVVEDVELYFDLDPNPPSES